MILETLKTNHLKFQWRRHEISMGKCREIVKQNIKVKDN